jgi:hypothetical protein
MEITAVPHRITEDNSRLEVAQHATIAQSVEFARAALRRDSVALLKDVGQDDADTIMFEVAASFALSDQLEIQAGFADFHGHRKRATRYFMTVNTRDDYQFIPAHSEGTHTIGMQLAAFYGFENSTDGGASVLMNVDADSPAWADVREVAYRGIARNGPLTREAALRARAVYGLESTSEQLADGDQVLATVDSTIPGLEVLRVLAKARPVHSRILERDLYAYWDSIASYDFASGEGFHALLQASGLLRNSEPPLGIEALDNAFKRRVWRSTVDYPALFRCRLTARIAPGDLLIQNNVTWTHSTCNWTPGSGVRRVVAAFA